jgi:hypothetical protein
LRAAPMSTYTLWALAEALGSDALLVVESADGTMEEPSFTVDGESVRRFLSTNGMPSQIVTNASAAVRIVRQAEPRLFQVPATVLKPKDVVGPIVALLLREYRRRHP